MRLDYDELSPITGRKTVLKERDENLQEDMFLCMETGYHTYSSWKLGSFNQEEFDKKSPEFIQESKFIDENNQVWYKVTMMTRDVVLCPEDFGWKVNSFRDLYIDEVPEPHLLMKVVKNAAGQEFKQVLDDNLAVNFLENQFEDAVIEFHRRCSEIYNINEN